MSTVTWSYSGSASSLKQACAALSGTFIAAGGPDLGGPDLGCADSTPSSFSCVAASMKTCEDYALDNSCAASDEKAACSKNGDTVAAGACTHIKAVGGCKLTLTGKGTVTLWSYTGTADFVMQICAKQSGVFVSP